MNPRLAISNLAWSIDLNRTALESLVTLGVAGVEVAPTRIADWPELTRARLREYSQDLTSVGLRASSLQAIFFNRPKAQLLGDTAGFVAIMEHMRRVAEIAQILEAKVAVFGAPRNRNRGALPLIEARELAIERLRQLGDVAASGDLVIGMEPIPAQYGGDFLMTADEVIDMVGAVAHPFVRVHLDTGCVMLGGGAIDQAIRSAQPLLAHFHATEPMLGSFASPMEAHALAAGALREAGYDRWIAIEMKEQAPDSLAAVETAVRFVQKTYFG